MNKIFLIGAVAVLFTSCSKAPKCSDEEVKKEVIALYKKTIYDEIEAELKTGYEENEYYTRFLPLMKNAMAHLNDLEIKLTEVTSTEIKDEIKKCVCEASFNTVEKNPILEADRKDTFINPEFPEHQFRIENFTPTIKYSAQITDDKKMKIVIENLDELEIIKNNIHLKTLRDFYNESKKLNLYQ